MMDKDSRSTLGLLLVEGFSLMSYASVIEPFRAANTLAERDLYCWRHVSIDGKPVRASNGAMILADCSVGQKLECDTLFIVAGGDPSDFSHRPTFAWLRELGRSSVRLAGVSGGPFLLARAGVLDGHRTTIHWDHHTAFTEAFPYLEVEPGLFVIDRRRLTCAGGTAGLDLAIELIERDHGHGLAARVSDWFIRTERRTADEAQRLGLRDRYRVTNDRVLKSLAKMEATVEAPVSVAALARLSGVSRRQLERLFAIHLNRSVSETYLQIRLDQAAHLLRRTAMSVTETAIACGFQSVSHFSRVYKIRFGRSPRAERRPGNHH